MRHVVVVAEHEHAPRQVAHLGAQLGWEGAAVALLILVPAAAPAADPPPAPAPDVTFKKEPAAPGAAFPAQRTPWGFLQSLVSIKQEKPADPDEPPGAPHPHYGGLFAGV